MPQHNKYTNTVQYSYYTEKGKKGTGGFTISKAYDLMKKGSLGLNKKLGKKKNYI